MTRNDDTEWMHQAMEGLQQKCQALQLEVQNLKAEAEAKEQHYKDAASTTDQVINENRDLRGRIENLTMELQQARAMGRTDTL